MPHRSGARRSSEWDRSVIAHLGHERRCWVEEVSGQGFLEDDGTYAYVYQGRRSRWVTWLTQVQQPIDVESAWTVAVGSERPGDPRCRSSRCRAYVEAWTDCRDRGMAGRPSGLLSSATEPTTAACARCGKTGVTQPVAD